VTRSLGSLTEEPGFYSVLWERHLFIYLFIYFQRSGIDWIVSSSFRC
jgi:hypothetical protein